MAQFPGSIGPLLESSIQHGQPAVSHELLERLLSVIATTGPKSLMARKCRAFAVLGYSFVGARHGGARLEALLKLHWQALDEMTRMKRWKSICAHLHGHLDKLLDLLQLELRTDMEDFVAWMLVDMHAHLDAPGSLNRYAQRLGVTRVHLSREFTRIVGQCFRDELSQIRLHTADELLTKSSDRIGAIAAKVGFRSPSQFVAFFRRQTGRTPLAHRRRQFRLFNRR